MSYKNIEVIDCVRDAIQGLYQHIPVQQKIEYINLLLSSNAFSCLDIGSFVSPKAVPQMADTAAVLAGLQKKNDTRLSVIVANERGVSEAMKYDIIDYLGYPFSISETFQQRNTHSSIAESVQRVKLMQEMTASSDKKMLIYLSMAFGNPYDDAWNKELVVHWLHELQEIGITHFSLADTTAEAMPDRITEVFQLVITQYPNLNPSIHLHSRAENSLAKIDAAYDAGCRKFEGAILGYGGCPFAQDNLVGNIPTELLLRRFEKSSLEELQPIVAAFKDLVGPQNTA
ncbi:hydroxymethylglutaryl-CoA lyase [Sphingobacterium sp. lm-10]|uniref:hydroxymethylglutaryl-CoA lyase n=1 Tax=Sphingobacterium sp. lm-10 TaxID=2944904 RepID=UPI002020A0D7|nr:hydroxymethylglutaryl-CoA lyase [Sphingobacterium sp. lm-10]MCL7988438.1 hydroxymethylglutaryl-CoA lyase [Sphingobacterium sp. lm-10]